MDNIEVRAVIKYFCDDEFRFNYNDASIDEVISIEKSTSVRRDVHEGNS